MAFTPVDLKHPSGSEWTARNPVELNDLTARGYQRVAAEKRLAPTPRPRTAYSQFVSGLSEDNSDAE